MSLRSCLCCISSLCGAKWVRATTGLRLICGVTFKPPPPRIPAREKALCCSNRSVDAEKQECALKAYSTDKQLHRPTPGPMHKGECHFAHQSSGEPLGALYPSP